MNQEQIAENLLKANITVVVKNIMQQANKEIRALRKADEISLNAKVGTSRYWKAIANVEHSLKQVEKYMEQLRDMDQITNWSDKLHQDIFNFTDKYPTVLEKYERYKNIMKMEQA